ncbi:hypothetical protein A1353_22000 [Methylomonas methanica]|uniref:DUF2202 domain-containing protein n=1 Tax=Methylomonas methanica TaxID=421 RepID=A0A177LZA4_METMH|nr:hypothetical protein [Methylomonas methanica]OAH98229.1 hypothetical protein A1353_22000 [Methylomonas methanica]
MHQTITQRLTEALQDEYKSRATYRKVIEKFGPVRPFINIVEAEGRHVDALLALFEHYQIPVPEDRWLEQISVPDTFEQACLNAVADEKANTAMYDQLIAASPEPDIRRVLEHLQAASRDRHLPAFERNASKHGKGGMRKHC